MKKNIIIACVFAASMTLTYFTVSYLMFKRNEIQEEPKKWKLVENDKGVEDWVKI